MSRKKSIQPNAGEIAAAGLTPEQRRAKSLARQSYSAAIACRRLLAMCKSTHRLQGADSHQYVACQMALVECFTMSVFSEKLEKLGRAVQSYVNDGGDFHFAPSRGENGVKYHRATIKYVFDDEPSDNGQNSPKE